MIPQKVKDHIEEYISQEVYVQVAIIKGKEKVSTEAAIDKYFNTNHFRDFSEGKPYFHFIDGTWSLNKRLPLHLCGISSLITCVILFVDKKQFLFEILFYAFV